MPAASLPLAAASPQYTSRASAVHLRCISAHLLASAAQVWLEPVPAAYISALEISPSVEARADGAANRARANGNGTLRAQVSVRVAACGGGAARAAALAAALRGGATAQLRLSTPEHGTSSRGVDASSGGGVGGAAGRWGVAPVRPGDQQAECSLHADPTGHRAAGAAAGAAAAAATGVGLVAGADPGVDPGEEAAVALRFSCKATLAVGDVSLWSPEAPHLYRVSVALRRGGGGGSPGQAISPTLALTLALSRTLSRTLTLTLTPTLTRRTPRRSVLVLGLPLRRPRAWPRWLPRTAAPQRRALLILTLTLTLTLSPTPALTLTPTLTRRALLHGGATRPGLLARRAVHGAL